MAQPMSIKRNVEMCHGQVSVPAIYHVSQGDKGTRIILGLVNNSANYTIPEGTTATIRGHRADGTLFTEITADVETTEVKFNLTEDMSAVPGRAECEAVLASGSANIIGTANFIINVEKSPASIGSVFPGTDAATTWLIDKLENEPINELNGESVVDAINGGSGSGLTEDVKVALLACFEKVAWIDEDGQDYYDALYDALYPPADLVSISAVYTQSGTVYNTDTLDSLKTDLIVTAHMSDSSTQTVTTYLLSGTLTEGTSIITVSYGGKTTTFNVTVTYVSPNLLYSWDLTNSLTDNIDDIIATTNATHTVGSGIIFDNSGRQYVDFNQVYATDRTYEIDFGTVSSIPSIGRYWMIDTDADTSGGGSGFIYNSTKQGALFYENGSGWESSTIMTKSEFTASTLSNSTLKFYIDSEGYVDVYLNNELKGTSARVMPTYTNGHIYIGSSGGTDNINAVITGFKVYEGEEVN